MGRPRVVISTSLGDLVFKLYPDVAPATVQNFLDLAESGFFEQNPSFIYRVIPEFVAQGGPLSEEGEQISGNPIKGEFGSLKHERGVISMARAEDPDSASCHFFICLGTLERLDRQYASFGRLVEGEATLSVIEEIERTDGSDGKKSKPIDPIKILRVLTQRG